MEKYWLIRESRQRLVIVALGWAADWHALGDFHPEGYDVLVLYDYRELEPLPLSLGCEYSEVRLIAWSFGVWAAEQIFLQDSGWNFTNTVAINGSPYPVSDEWGIPVRVFGVTLRGIEKTGIERFNEQMFGSIEALRTHRDRLSERDFHEQLTELKILGEASQKPYSPHLRWSHAIVGFNDRIFPAANLCNYWGEGTLLKNIPHYPFLRLELIYDELK